MLRKGDISGNYRCISVLLRTVQHLHIRHQKCKWSLCAKLQYLDIVMYLHLSLEKVKELRAN